MLKSEYPTEEQIKEMWAALESGDDQKILEVLHKRERERAEADESTNGDSHKGA